MFFDFCMLLLHAGCRVEEEANEKSKTLIFLNAFHKMKVSEV